MVENRKEYCVLVVDDLAENIDVLAGSLVDRYEVKVALNGEDAIETALEKPQPDIILLDIMMPEMDGYEVSRILKSDKRTREIPIIFVTAMNEIKDEEKGFNLGGVDYITKPIRPSIVLARVKAHLELKQAREDLKEQNHILRDNIRLREDVETIIRHDLKTPINVAMWAPDMLKSEGNLTESQVEILDILKQACSSMLKIVNSSISLIKMERGEYQVESGPVNIIKPLFKVINELKGLMGTRHLDLKVFINKEKGGPSDSFIIEGENILFYTILANLIKNAIEASPPEETISVFLEDEKDKIIKIHNMGAVPQGIRDRFFNKYVTDSKRSGTGLGTYSAKLIVQTLNGSIKMDTSREKGTMVSLNFPVNK